MSADSKGVRRVYAGTARTYDQRWRRYLDVTVERTITALPDPLEGPLLDVGCGSGLLVERVAQRHPAVPITGVDLSPEMLAVARERVPRGARLVLANAAALPFRHRSFQNVTTSSSLHHWPDPLVGLREIGRVMRPGGTLALTDWRADHLPTRIRDIALRITDPSHQRALYVADLRSALFAAGFEVAAVDRYRAGWSWGMITITARLGA